MWKNLKYKRYFWTAIHEDLDRLISELVEAEEEEETDLYRFDLHLQDQEDLNVFTKKERQEITRHFERLIKDTRKHSRMIAHMRKRLQSYKEQFKDVE